MRSSERHERDDDAEEVGPLRQGGAGEKPAVALADEAEPVARRDALGDERLGDGVEVVEGVLLALEPAVVPLGLAELAAATQVREDERAARLDEGGQLAEVRGEPPREVPAAVAVEERRPGPGPIGLRASDEPVGDVGAVGAPAAAQLGNDVR